MKTALIAGATGMVGNLVVQQCLNNPQISGTTILVRKASNLVTPGVKEVVIEDFNDYTGWEAVFTGIDIAFFCIGVYTGQVPDEAFKKITVDYAIAFADALKTHSPQATLCFLSGSGSDRSEKSRVPFAKYKGMAENGIADLGLTAFYTFRPAYIYPVEPRREPNIGYKIIRALYPVMKLLGKNASIKSTELAEAMVRVGLEGADKEVLENRDILEYVDG